jgi:hypothetical protein
MPSKQEFKAKSSQTDASVTADFAGGTVWQVFYVIVLSSGITGILQL